MDSLCKPLSKDESNIPLADDDPQGLYFEAFVL